MNRSHAGGEGSRPRCSRRRPPQAPHPPQLLHGAQLVEDVAAADGGDQLCQHVGLERVGAHLRFRKRGWSGG
jgi:hypothetical protein